MEIRGFQRLSLIDFPGKVSSVVFTPGCNLRCPFCYNRELVLNPNSLPLTSEKYFFDFLGKRKGLLDGVVVSGGEPTLQSDLVEFLGEIKSLGFLTKLDTNGTNYESLKKLIDGRLVDYVAMDVKEIKSQKSKIKSAEGKFRIYSKSQAKEVEKSVDFLKEGNVDYEFRTTVVPGIHTLDVLEKMAKELSGAKKWFLQPFQPIDCLEPSFSQIVPYDSAWLELTLEALRKIVPNAFLRD